MNIGGNSLKYSKNNLDKRMKRVEINKKDLVICNILNLRFKIMQKKMKILKECWTLQKKNKLLCVKLL